jgi:hypothetical protein
MHHAEEQTCLSRRQGQALVFNQLEESYEVIAHLSQYVFLSNYFMSSRFPFWLRNSNLICDGEQSAPGDDFPGAHTSAKPPATSDF